MILLAGIPRSEGRHRGLRRRDDGHCDLAEFYRDRHPKRDRQLVSKTTDATPVFWANDGNGMGVDDKAIAAHDKQFPPEKARK